MKNLTLLAVSLLIFSFNPVNAFQVDSATVMIPADKVVKIWDKGGHNAFTDLIRFKNDFYCTFREGSGHASGENGKVRILKSADGKTWKDFALLEKTGLDLRDPKLSITPQGRLMINMGGTVYDGTTMLERNPQVSFLNEDDSKFSNPQSLVIDKELKNSWDWIWRITWHKGVGYGIDYKYEYNSGIPKATIYLVKTIDGIHYDKVSYIDAHGYPNECTIRFDEDDNIQILIRRDADDMMGVFATGTAPYNKLNMRKLNYRLGGPNFLNLGKDKIVLGTRYFAKPNESRTAIYVTNGEGKILKTILLPSTGDSSYPGLVIYDKELWVSYYASHENKTSIYLTRIALSELYK